MVTFVVWCLLSLVLAVAVFLVASVMERLDTTEDGAPGGARAFWADFRAGLRRERRQTAVPEPMDTDMDDFFAATIESAPAYVDADQLTDALQRARVQARSTLHVGTVSRPQ
jgi:hypothetical protein